MPDTALYKEHSTLGLLMRQIVGTDDATLAGIAQGPCHNTTCTACTVQALDGRKLRIDIGHDNRCAPYALAHGGNEDTSLLVSFTDECGTRLLSYACATAENGLCGLGIDLCCISEFAVETTTERFCARFFSDAERARVASTRNEKRAELCAAIFSGKEAAFKSTSQALRWHYERGGEDVHFTVHDFAIDGHGGALPTGPASDACAKLGITRIDLHQEQLDDMIASVATARR